MAHLILWLAWAGLLLGGFIGGRLNREETRRMPAWTRMASSFMLVAAAWVWYGRAWESTAVTLAFLVAVGMSLGFLGDLLMARLLPVKQPVIGAMAAFGLGHLLYIVAWLQWSQGVGLDDLVVGWLSLAGWQLLGLMGWYVVVFRGQRPSALHWAALLYALLLAGTAAVGTALAIQAPALIPLAVGATLFLISDLILATRLFNQVHFKLIDDVVWLTYGPAQMLIVYSVGVALWLGGS